MPRINNNFSETPENFEKFQDTNSFLSAKLFQEGCKREFMETKRMFNNPNDRSDDNKKCIKEVNRSKSKGSQN